MGGTTQPLSDDVFTSQRERAAFRSPAGRRCCKGVRDEILQEHDTFSSPLVLPQQWTLCLLGQLLNTHLSWQRKRKLLCRKQTFSSKPEKYYFVESVTNDVKNWLTVRVSPFSNRRD